MHETTDPSPEPRASRSAEPATQTRSRLTIGPVLGALVVAIYLIDERGLLWRSGALTAFVMGALALGGVHEFVRMFDRAGFPIAGRTLRTVTVGLCLCPFFVEAAGIEAEFPLAPLTVSTIVLVFPLAVLSLRQDRMARGVELASLSLFGFVLIAWPMYLAQLMAFHHVPAVLFVVVVCKGGDVAAYAVGRILGRTALIPHVSGGKTVEGVVASAVASGLLAIWLEPLVLQPRLSLGLAFAIPVGMFLSVTTQTGDLIESMLKRRCGVKDSSMLLPAHGGVLDLVDSLLFSIPAFALVLAIHENFPSTV